MKFKSFWVQFKIKKESNQSYIEKTSFIIGRAPDSDLFINSAVVSRRHLKVYLDENRIYIEDLSSTNGTYLNDGLLEPNEAYEYKSTDRLYIDTTKEVQIRINLLKDQPADDIDLDIERAQLEKKRRQRKVNRQSTVASSKQNYLVSATESVDNIFDNLFFIAKSARFSKEKQIKEAEYISQEMMEKAQQEIEENRALLEMEIKNLQTETKNEAKRLINSATSKADKILTQASDKSKKMVFEADDKSQQIRNEADTYSDQKKQEADDYYCAQKTLAEKHYEEQKNKAYKAKDEILERAQEKHREIIESAHLKNTELKLDNKNLKNLISDNKNQVQKLSEEICSLNDQHQKADLLCTQAKQSYDKENSRFLSLKNEVEALEKRGAEARLVLDKEIPGLESTIAKLKTDIKSAEKETVSKRQELERLSASVQEKSEEIEKFEEKNKAWENRLDDLNKKIIETEDNLFRLHKIKQQRNEELDAEIAERRQRQKNSEEASLLSIEKKKARAQKEIDINLAKAKEKALSILSEAQAKAEAKAESLLAEAQYKTQLAEQKWQETESETKDLRKKIHEECDKLQKDTNLEIENRRRNFNNEIEKEKAYLLSDASQKATDMTTQAAQQAEEMTDRAQQQAEEMTTQAAQQADELLAQATQQAHELKTQAQELYDRESTRVEKVSQDIMSSTQAERDRVLQSMREQADQAKETLEQELVSLREHAEQEIKEMRTNAVKRLEEQREKSLTEDEQRKQIQAMRLRKDLGEVVRARLSPFLKDSNNMQRVAEIVNKSIDSVLLDEIDEDFKNTENYSDFDPRQAQEKVKKFWVGAVGAGATLLVLFFLMPTFKKAAVESGRSLATHVEEGTQKAIEKVQKENDLSKIFNPEQTSEYKATYTERVVYTQAYVATELNPEFREQWILELQDYFVHSLRLDENNLVPFIALEANLIRELDEERQKINGHFVEEGLVRMREIEASFDKKIRQNIKSDDHYKKIMTFKKKFFETNSDKVKK